MPGLDPGIHQISKESYDEDGSPGQARPRRCGGCASAFYCTPSATKRHSPLVLATSSRTDFLPSFLSWSMRFLTSAALLTASCATSTMTSPGLRRFSAASEELSTLVMMTPLTLSLIL